MNPTHKQQVDAAAAYIADSITQTPVYGMVLGTGLDALADAIQVQKVWDYADIPHMSPSTMALHKGRLLYGRWEGVPVLIMQGRLHYYEGYDMQAITFGIRLMCSIGCQRLLLSNVAGGLNAKYRKGDVMLLSDHIDLLPANPLRGPNIEAWGGRFPDMRMVYDPEMRHIVKEKAKAKGIRLHEGVYVAVSGPNLETPAEYRYLQRIGADAVGMSTVPEAIVACHMGRPCIALSIITDLCYLNPLPPIDIPDIMATIQEAEPKLTELLRHVVTTYKK